MALLHQRAELYQVIRTFFLKKHVLEVETPVLSNSASCDVNLDSFATSLRKDGPSLYLQTSPEFAMKRLLAAGSPCIYQIAKSFRQAERGRFHNPEFTLLEWYRLNFSMAELMGEVAELLRLCFSAELVIETISYHDLFFSMTGIKPHATTIEQLMDYASAQGNPEAANICGESLANGLDYVFSQYIQPMLLKERVYFVSDYPVCMAMLAKLTGDSPQTAKRFEVYFNNVELANGYEELTDAELQEMRFRQDIKERELAAKDEVPIDQNLIAALKAGMPACSGVALGLDRLMMLMSQASSIDEVLSFPVERA